MAYASAGMHLGVKQTTRADDLARRVPRKGVQAGGIMRVQLDRRRNLLFFDEHRKPDRCSRAACRFPGEQLNAEHPRSIEFHAHRQRV